MISAVHFTSVKVISEILETPLPIYLNSKELLNHTKPFHILYQVDKLGYFFHSAWPTSRPTTLFIFGTLVNDN